MTDDKWREVLDNIKEKFEIEEEFDGEIENIPNATFEGIVFFTPIGKMKITRTRRPKVLDKKTQHSNRIGGTVNVEYIYSEDEFVDDMEIHKWNDMIEDWVEAEFNL